jgi:hypothetical protein
MVKDVLMAVKVGKWGGSASRFWGGRKGMRNGVQGLRDGEGRGQNREDGRGEW